MIEKSHSFAPRTLVFKLQQELLKFNDICVNWSYPKTHLVTNFLNPQNRSFENVSIVTSSKCLTFLHLITYLFLFLTYFFNWIKNIPLLNNLFLSYPIYFFNWIKEHPLKEHGCNFKIDKITYSKSQSITKLDDNKNKPSLYP